MAASVASQYILTNCPKGSLLFCEYFSLLSISNLTITCSFSRKCYKFLKATLSVKVFQQGKLYSFSRFLMVFSNF